MKSTRFIVWVLLVVGLNVAYADQATHVTAQNAWIRETPPTQTLSSGYLDLMNHGDDAVQLVAVESDAVRVIEMHTATQRGDTMGMERLNAITLLPGRETTLRPGGDHLMLIDMTRSPRLGEPLPVTLIFADGSRLEVDAEVRSGPFNAPHSDAEARSNRDGEHMH
ncbi:MAG: copper chaperone PCu(A)C [Natronospirillum sp.]